MAFSARELSARCGEETRARAGDCVDKKTAVEVEVPRLAARLGDQKAAVTRRAVQRAILVRLAGVMIRADRIARA